MDMPWTYTGFNSGLAASTRELTMTVQSTTTAMLLPPTPTINALKYTLEKFASTILYAQVQQPSQTPKDTSPTQHKDNGSFYANPMCHVPCAANLACLRYMPHHLASLI
mmetsp:Transcript_17713/g.41076  ORF Transcript_17713/g.41076 Transcript_17713/m.41076 type:complete len:109 (+) Transcript_17713:41-367(+)